MRAPPHGRAHPGQQLVHLERLGDVVVRAGVERLDLLVAGRPRGQHDDRHRVPSADAVQDLDAVEVGQSEVEDDDVGMEAGDAVEGARARWSAISTSQPARLHVDPERPRRGARRRRRPAPASSRVTGLAWSGHHVGRIRLRERDGHDHRQPAAGGVLGLDAGADRLAEAAGDGQAQPDAGSRGASPSRWNGMNIRSRSASVDAGAAVDDAHLQRAVGHHCPAQAHRDAGRANGAPRSRPGWRPPARAGRRR